MTITSLWPTKTQTPRMQIGELTPLYRAYMEHEKRFAKGTVAAYLSDLRDLAKLLPGEVDRVGAGDLRKYLRHLSERGLTERTISRKFAALHTFWRWMLREGHTNNNPLDHIELPKLPHRLPIWISEQDLQKFAMTPVVKFYPQLQRRDQLAFRLLAWLGLRRSELLDLKIEDVMFEAGVIVIRKPKNKHDRALPIPAQLKDEIRGVIAGRKSGYLLTSRYGNKWGVSKFAAAFDDHIVRCGLLGKGITPHVIRHSVATHLHERGVGLPEIQQLLGHVDIKSTMLYVHTSTAALQGALSNHILNEVK